jgi:hypothetical protein
MQLGSTCKWLHYCSSDEQYWEYTYRRRYTLKQLKADPTFLPWSWFWSYRVRRAQGAVDATEHSAAAVANQRRHRYHSFWSEDDADVASDDGDEVAKEEKNVDAAVHRLHLVSADAWLFLYQNTTNDTARRWARIMCNFHARMCSTSLRLLDEFDFTHVKKRLGKVLCMPMSKQELAMLHSKMADASLDNDESAEHDVTEGKLIIKQPDWRNRPGPNAAAGGASPEVLVESVAATGASSDDVLRITVRPRAMTFFGYRERLAALSRENPRKARRFERQHHRDPDDYG